MSAVLVGPRPLVEAYLLLRGVADPVARHELATAVLRSLEDAGGSDMVGAILAECRHEQRVAPPAAAPATMRDHELVFDVLAKRWRSWSARLVAKPALALMLLIAVVLAACT